MCSPQFLPLLLGAALAAVVSTESAGQDNSALVNALVRKGVLSTKEAAEIQSEIVKETAATSAGKVKLSNSITELKLYGDLRLRYQYDERQPQVPSTANISQRSRWRFRLRLDADVQLGKDFFGGFELQTGQNSDAANQTFENGFDDYNIFISKAFVGWRPNDWLTVVLGKQKNPFYTTDLVWDPDINPQGITETVAFHKLLSGGSSRPWELTFVAGQFIFEDNQESLFGSDANSDVYIFAEQIIGTWKFNKATSVTFAPGFISFTAGSLSGLQNENAFTDVSAITIGPAVTTQTTTSTVLTTTDVVNAAGTATSRTVQPTTVETVVTTTTNPDGTRTVATNQRTVRVGAARAAGILPIAGVPGSSATTVATTASTTAAPVAAAPTLPAVSGETRHLQLLTAPGDVTFKIGSLKTKVYWDFSYNLDGRERFEDTYQFRISRDAGLTDQRFSSRDGIAWLLGVQLGETKKKGDWALFGNYRETGIASVDPNLNESDFAAGELNSRGFRLGFAYQIADAVVFNLTGTTSWNLRKDLVGGRATNAVNSTNPGIAQDNAAKVLQVDLNVKF